MFKKNFNTSHLFVFPLLFSVMFLFGCSQPVDETEDMSAQNCQDFCFSLNQNCVEINLDQCQKDCVNWDEAKRNCLKQAESCDEIENGCPFSVNLFSQTDNLEDGSINCLPACENYASKCMPPTGIDSPELRQQAIDSCLVQCREEKWDSEKANCMEEAMYCEDFVDVCGL